MKAILVENGYFNVLVSPVAGGIRPRKAILVKNGYFNVLVSPVAGEISFYGQAAVYGFRGSGEGI